MLKHLKRGMLAGLMIVLVACSSVPPAGPVDNRSISSMRAALAARANEYQEGSKAWANKEWWNNGPLILLGTGSVAAASFASGAARANWLIGLGLAAGAWALGYSTLGPETKQDAYAAAAAQLSCLATQTASVDDNEPANSNLKSDRADLPDSITILNDQIGNAQGKRAVLPAALSNSDQLMVLAADAAVARAKQTITAANAELQAASVILPTLSGLYYAMDRKAQLAARGKLLTAADVSSALSAAAAGGGSTPSGSAKKDKGIGGSQKANEADKKPLPPSKEVQAYVQAAGAAGRSTDDLAAVPIVSDKIYTTALAAIKQCVAN